MAAVRQVLTVIPPNTLKDQQESELNSLIPNVGKIFTSSRSTPSSFQKRSRCWKTDRSTVRRSRSTTATEITAVVAVAKVTHHPDRDLNLDRQTNSMAVGPEIPCDRLRTAVTDHYSPEGSTLILDCPTHRQPTRIGCSRISGLQTFDTVLEKTMCSMTSDACADSESSKGHSQFSGTIGR